MFSSIRARLTLWYVSLLGVVLILFGIGVYLFVARSLYERVDATLSATLQDSVSTLLPVLGRQASKPDAIKRVIDELRIPNQTIAVIDASGKVVAQRTGPGGPPLRLPPGFSLTGSHQFYELLESGDDMDDGCRGVFQQVADSKTALPYAVAVTQSLEPLEDQIELVEDVLLVVIPLTLLLAGLGGWLLARRSLAPVLAMSERAGHMSADNLDQRLEVANPRDELGRLAITFNELLERLSKSFAQQRQFMADASHELRTPLSAIRTAAAVTLQKAERESSEYREALTIVEQEARRLTRIVEDMFTLARADAGPPSLQPTRFYLDELLAESTRAAAVLAAQKRIQFEASPLVEAPFFGDEALLRQMMWNLLDNALKHTPEAGRVGISLESRNSEYVITVTDSGPGIPPEIQPRIFERFYRADEARVRTESTTQSGAGLGLPIARWVAQAHGGQLELHRSDSSGSTFIVILPHAS